jgi:two-component system C4-dicarboxylate transport sensor histidine kinase DctB
MQSERRMPAISLPPEADDAAWLHAANMAELGVMTASLLHELRQPLFAIKAHSQLARAEGPSPRFDAVLEQVQHIEALLRYYGNFGRNDEPEVLYDFNNAVRGAVEMLGWRGKRAGVEIASDLGHGSLPVRGREVAARQVAVNLVQNAMDAVEGTPDPRVLVRTRLVGDRVRLEVEDHGPGIPPELKTRMYEPFVTTKPPGRGTGLGLFIAQRLVHEARGTMAVAVPEGGGTLFSVELPKG